MAKAKFDIKAPLDTATRPFYAAVGVTDRAVELARGYATTVQGRVADVQTRVSKIDFEPKALREQAFKEAKDAQARLEAQVTELQNDVKALPVMAQVYVSETFAEVTETYEGLALRGKVLVERIRGQQATHDAQAAAKTTAAKVKTARTQATKSAKTAGTTAKTQANKTVGTAKSGAKATAGTAKTAAKTTTGTAKSAAKTSTAAAGETVQTARTNAKSTTTAAKKTAAAATQAAGDATEKVGD